MTQGIAWEAQSGMPFGSEEVRVLQTSGKSVGQGPAPGACARARSPGARSPIGSNEVDGSASNVSPTASFDDLTSTGHGTRDRQIKVKES